MQMIVFSSATFILFVAAFMWAIKYDKEVLKPKKIPNGIPAKGIILDFHKAGGEYSQPSGGRDNVYKMNISLKVIGENGDSWRTNTREFVRESQFNMFRIGETLHVKYDPESINNVVVDGELHKRYQP